MRENDMTLWLENQVMGRFCLTQFGLRSMVTRRMVFHLCASGVFDSVRVDRRGEDGVVRTVFDARGADMGARVAEFYGKALVDALDSSVDPGSLFDWD